MAIYKNKASQKVAVFAYNSSTGAATTGDAANITAQISKDGAATAATNDVNPTELDATDAPGVYIFDLTQAETDADLVIIAAVSSTSNILLEPLLIYTEPEQREANVTAVSGDSAAADNIEADYDGTGYNKSASTIGTCTANTDMRGTDSAYTGTPPTAASIRSEIDSNSTQLAAIVADTNELQTDDVPGLIAALDSVVDAIGVVVSSNNTAIAALNDVSAADVNAQCDTAISDAALATAANVATVDTVVDAIKVVTDQLVASHAEPSGVPAANETPLNKLAYLFAGLRNQITVTATKKQFYDDAGSAMWEKDLTDDGTTYTETEGNAP